MSFFNYFKAAKPERAIYLVEILLGALYIKNFHIFSLNFRELLFIFISFQVLYGGIYILNDVLDYSEDIKNYSKSKRIIASGKIKLINAFVFSLILIFLGLAISIYVSSMLMGFEIFFLLFNLVYSLILKKIAYIDSFANSVTHSARFILGIILFGTFTQYHLIIFYFLVGTVLSLMKRYKEIIRKESGRKCLVHYSRTAIKLISTVLSVLMILLIFLSKNIERATILIGCIIFLNIEYLYYNNKKFQKLINNFYSNM